MWDSHPMNESNGKCLYPECEKAGEGSRGLCRSHYQMAHHYVKTGRVTWEQLEAAGKCNKPLKKNASPSSWLLEGIK